MTLDDIPADEVVILTEQLDRAFRAVRCVPTCHCCGVPILIGDKFKLAMTETVDAPGLSSRWHGGAKDEMLCERCTPEKLLKKRQAVRRRWLADGGGYSRLHKPKGEVT